MMEEGGEKRKQKLRIVLVPWVFQGHINPMFLLASILHEKGFSITVAHAEFTPLNPSSHPDFSFIPLPDGFSGHDVGTSFGSFLNFHSAINTKIESLLLDRLSREIEDQSGGGGEKIACVIYDTIFCNVESAAHRLGIPSVSLHTSSATCLLVHLNLPDLQSYIPIPDGIGDEIAPGLDPLRFKDLDILLAPHLPEMLPFVAKTSNVTTAAAIILNTGSCLEQASFEEIKNKCGGGVPVFAPGPLFKLARSTSGSSSLLEENTDCLRWLDRQAPDSVIYISMGSLVRIETEEFEELAHALGDSEQAFLWVVRPDLVQGEAGTAAVIERLPEKVKRVVLEEKRGMVVEWAPQKEVLAHKAVGGFLSHCGWSSTVESMGEGVAMICRPGFGDQWVNARYVSAVWGAGLELGGGNRKALERGEIAAAIREVMSAKLGEEMRKKASDMKLRIESSIVKGGSSYNDLEAFVRFILSLQLPN